VFFISSGNLYAIFFFFFLGIVTIGHLDFFPGILAEALWSNLKTKVVEGFLEVNYSSFPALEAAMNELGRVLRIALKHARSGIYIVEMRFVIEALTELWLAHKFAYHKVHRRHAKTPPL